MRELRILSELEFKKILTTNYESPPDEEDDMINYDDGYEIMLTKMSVKKYKASKKISTRSFNQNNDKIYPQHSDHSDAKNIIIDRVNDDCLAEIFMYLPACERPKIALVCKKWKTALDNSWFRVKRLELIHWRFEENLHGLTEFPTVLQELSFLKSLLDKCGRYLTKLDLTAFDHCAIVPIINESCPNLVNLRLRLTHIYSPVLNNTFSRLSKLKVLTIIFHNLNSQFIPATLINSLRNVANTLTDLSLFNYTDFLGNLFYTFPKETDCVMSELKALERFETAGISFLEGFKGNRKLFKPFFISLNIESYGSTHELKDVKKINLPDRQITDNSLYFIANIMTQLEVLCIFCELVTDDGIVAISKMNKLQTLDLIGRNNVTDSSIKLIKNLTRLKLPFSNKITDDSVTEVLENSPDMEELYVEDTGVTVKFIKKAAGISKNRKRLLHVGVTFIPDITQYETRYLTIHVIKKKEQVPTQKVLTTSLRGQAQISCERAF